MDTSNRSNLMVKFDKPLGMQEQRRAAHSTFRKQERDYSAMLKISPSQCRHMAESNLATLKHKHLRDLSP